MADLSRILEMLDDLSARFEQVKAEVAELQTPGGRSAARSRARQPALSNVIPPTRTDDPDSIVGGRLVRLYAGSLSKDGGPADSYVKLMRYNVNAIVDALAR